MKETLNQVIPHTKTGKERAGTRKRRVPAQGEGEKHCREAAESPEPAALARATQAIGRASSVDQEAGKVAADRVQAERETAEQAQSDGREDEGVRLGEQEECDKRVEAAGGADELARAARR